MADDIKKGAYKNSKIDEIEESSLSDSLDIKQAPTVCIFGFSFKKNTGDARMSQAAYIINHLSCQEGINVHIHDP